MTDPQPVSAVPVHPVQLTDGVGAWFTGRPAGGKTAVGAPGNLAHRRPHLPSALARDRAAAFGRMGFAPEDVHLMQQVHGAAVGVVEPTTLRGAELRHVDALVTAAAGRPLAVQVADCVPLLLAAADGPVAAVHAGRRGVAANVVAASLAALAHLGAGPDRLHAVLGPAIGGCCYEVDTEVQAEVADAVPEAAASTTWDTPSLDLSAAVASQLAAGGVESVSRFGGCTRCTGSWFSHRADPAAGRQLGVVLRWAS